MDDTHESVRDGLDTYSDAVDKLVATTGEHTRSVESLDGAMANLKESVAEMTAAVDDYADAIDEFDTAVASLQRTATGERTPDKMERATEVTARARPGHPAAGD